jgi:hypothetical protein
MVIGRGEEGEEMWTSGRYRKERNRIVNWEGSRTVCLCSSILNRRQRNVIGERK